MGGLHVLAGVDEINTLLSVLPSVTMKASCEMEGEDEIMEGDVAKCKVRLGDCQNW
jgi:hypothetical protein